MQNPLQTMLVRRRLTWVAVAIALVPLFTAFSFMLNHRVNTIIADDWCGVAEVVDSAIDGGVTAGELFAQHNIHRPFTLYALTALSYSLTDWNRELDIGLSFFLMLCIFVLIVLIVRQTLPVWTPLAIILAALLLFSMRGRDFWVWAGLWSYLLSWLPLLVAVWLVQRLQVGWLSWTLVLLMAIVATYSLASGWITWFILPLLLWAKGYRRAPYYAGWVVVFALIGVAYFSGFQMTGQELRTSCDSWVSGEAGLSLATRLLTGTQLFLGHLTAPFLPGDLGSISLARLPGGSLVLFIALNLLWWRRLWGRRGQWATMMPLIVIMLYGLGAAAMTIYGRLRTVAVFNSGYQLHIAVFWAVFLVLVIATSAPQLRKPQRIKRILAGANLGIVFVLGGLYLYANSQAADMTRYPAEYQPYTHAGDIRETCLASAPFAGVDCLFEAEIAPQSPPESILTMTRHFAEARVNVFSDVTAMLPAEYVSGTPVIVAAAMASQHPILGYTTATNTTNRIPESIIYHLIAADQALLLSQHTSIDHLLNAETDCLEAIVILQDEAWLLAIDDAVGRTARTQLETCGYTLTEWTEDWRRRQFDWVIQVRADS